MRTTEQKSLVSYVTTMSVAAIGVNLVFTLAGVVCVVLFWEYLITPRESISLSRR